MDDQLLSVNSAKTADEQKQTNSGTVHCHICIFLFYHCLSAALNYEINPLAKTLTQIDWLTSLINNQLIITLMSDK